MALLFHIDESRDRRHHFHVGLLVDGADSSAAEHRLNEIVDDAAYKGARPDGAELHGYELFNMCGQWARATPADAVEVFDRTLAVLKECSIEVLIRGTRLGAFQRKYPGSDPYRWEFRNLLERLNERLQSRDEFALVIADQQHEYREMLQRDLMDSKIFGTGGYRSQKLTRILDTAHFVDSKLSRLTQLADMVAFVARRRNSVPKEVDARAETVMARWWQQVLSAIPDPDGQYYTIRG